MRTSFLAARGRGPARGPARGTAAAAVAVAAVLLGGTALLPAAATPRAAGAGVGQAPRAAEPRASAPPPLGPCGPGQLCLWPKPEFQGKRQVHELHQLDVDSCVPLPPGVPPAQALVNRTGRPVTTYQSAECAETGEFQTYPGDGVWLPRSPYQVRAFKVWEN
ncbi:peptidase inhibitor family I36 protein [Streptomyces sp. NPDC048603]|uniref:peptidase inhibitor family I36 protein n=1 Tax=Streptomyces sp. NPDC048603 TaxID=3365577 RepID=UPI0037143FF8